jgi:hypothetical protein
MMLLTLAMSFLLGCDQGSSASSDQPSKPSHSSVSGSTPFLPGTSTVRGTIRYEGPTPSLATITPGAKCHTGAPAIPDETVLVAPTGGLKNAIVFIEGAAASNVTAGPVTLDQVNCRYTPHVVALQTNQALTLRSSDDTLHNVHYSPALNPAGNFGMIKAGQEKTVAFKSPEFFKVTCDVHPWMAAWVGVFENHLFSVTNDVGGYEIKNVPAGKYTLVSWHERFGRQEKAIEIAEAQTVETTFVYKAPG